MNKLQSRELSKSKSAVVVEDVSKLSAEITKSRQANDKNEIALRRMAFTDKGTNQLTSNDTAKLQFKVNDLSRQLEDLKYEKLHLTTKIHDLEKSLSIKASKTDEDELRKKLQAAEQLCEELMDENNEVKKELRGMEEEIDEMQDNFREDQTNEYSTLKKDLEATTKNCRILSFKLKKSERKIEQLEQEKQSSAPAALISQIKQLEEELKISNDRLQQMQVKNFIFDIPIYSTFDYLKNIFRSKLKKHNKLNQVVSQRLVQLVNQVRLTQKSHDRRSFEAVHKMIRNS